MKITVNMATFPPRKEGLKKRLLELAPQCDIIRVYLNNYSEWPADVPLYENVEYVLGDGKDYPNMGSQGKLMFIDPGREEYYLTVDDDIFYPPDYVEKIVEGCESFNNKFIVGYHGCIFRVKAGGGMPVRFWDRRLRQLFMYSHGLYRTQPVHMIGNATMCCVPSEIGLNRNVIQGPLNSGDDADIAVWAQNHRTPMFILKRDGRWLLPDNDLNMIEANHKAEGRKELQHVKLDSVKSWRCYVSLQAQSQL